MHIVTHDLAHELIVVVSLYCTNSVLIGQRER